MKKNLDQYFTNEVVVETCISFLKSKVSLDGKHFIEPSAGGGAFLDKLPSNTRAFDIEPKDSRVVYADFLTIKTDYNQHNVVIGNPPFGEKMNLCIKFFKRSIQWGDVVAFVLPISQLNNNRMLYEFDLVGSLDLGIQDYSGVMLHCCFNVYKKATNGFLPKPKPVKLESVTIVRQDSKKYNDFEYDLRLCYWGNGSGGKLLDEGKSAAAIYKIKVTNGWLYEVKRVLTNTNWKKELNCIAMVKIQQHHINTILKRELPEIY